MNNWLKTKDLSAIGVSLLLHIVILGSMAIYRFEVLDLVAELAIDSITTEEREHEDINKELSLSTEVSTTDNQVAGGTLASTVGSSSQMEAPQQKIETSVNLKNPTIRINSGNVIVPGESQMSDSMGEMELSGETGAVVEGYGAALSLISQEMLRLLRDDKILIVWLFDESESMKDDQKEIAKNFEKIYRELGLILAKKEKKKGSKRRKNRDADAPLLTSIIGYGENIHPLTKKPTADLNTIRAAISKVAIDKSGKENMCTAILKSMKEYAGLIATQKRKLVFIVVSDESGDDGGQIEDTIVKARRFRSPIYILGREAVFGYTHARVRWRDPQYGLTFWLKVNRGPETAHVECMQWDGLRDRYDVYSSGFGPYEQVRLAKETGGVFYVLPGNEKNLIGPGANEKRKFDFLNMKEYQPLLLARRDYETARNRSKNFRDQIWKVIVTLNPNDDNPLPRYDENLKIRELYYQGNIVEFKKEASKQAQKAARAMQLLNQAIEILDKAQPFRQTEDSQRWRASYDLLRAQCYAYRVRLFQFLLATDDHVSKNPKFTKPNSNRWNVRRTTSLLKPDEAQYRRLMSAFKLRITREEYLKQMDDQMQEATKRYRLVIAEHPGTPWSRRASAEMRQGFGMKFVEHYRDGRYDKLKIKQPKY